MTRERMSTTGELNEFQRLAREHRDADQLIAGHYGFKIDGEFKGCSVGCFAHAFGLVPYDHAGVAERLGVPEWVVRLQDRVFEGLTDDRRGNWHVNIADAYAARTRDWRELEHDVHIAILTIAARNAGDALPAVQTVLDLHRARTPADDPQWRAARDAARRAARSAARSAAWSAARSAAESAAESAAYAAWSAAESAAESAAFVEIADAILTAITKQYPGAEYVLVDASEAPQ